LFLTKIFFIFIRISSNPYILFTTSAVLRFVDNSRVAAFSRIFLHTDSCSQLPQRSATTTISVNNAAIPISQVLKRFQPLLFSLFLCLGEAADVFDLCMSLFIKQRGWGGATFIKL
jgi:hypothetical protein